MRSQAKAIVNLGIYAGIILFIGGAILWWLALVIEKRTRNPKLLETAAKAPYVALVAGVVVFLLTFLYLFSSDLLLIWKNYP